jgi:hypothetical protein
MSFLPEVLWHLPGDKGTHLSLLVQWAIGHHWFLKCGLREPCGGGVHGTFSGNLQGGTHLHNKVRLLPDMGGATWEAEIRRITVQGQHW